MNFTELLISIIGKSEQELLLKHLETGAESREDVVEFVHSLVDLNNPMHVEALNSYLDQRFGHSNPGGQKSSKLPANSIKPLKVNSGDQKSIGNIPSITESGHKNKFVPLFQDNQSAGPILPGRFQCQCLCTKHDLVANCLKCGRIVCAQEGSGPCFFCSNIVCTRDESRLLKENSKAGKTLRSIIMNIPAVQNDEALRRAEEQKTRLLEQDRSNASRTKVIDDQMDYWAQSEGAGRVWLSAHEKQRMLQREKKLRAVLEASHREAPLGSQHFTHLFNPGSHQPPPAMPTRDERRAQAAHELYCQSGADWTDPMDCVSKRDFVDPAESVLTDFMDLKFQQIKSSQNQDPIQEKRRVEILQDSDLHQLSDEGLCLTLDQPWASFLVAGVKKHEGRSWYSCHRGRLWIASSAKRASAADISSAKDFYLARNCSEKDFPSEFLSGCLLGSVDIVDCVPSQVYQQEFADVECDQEFVLICQMPWKLPTALPLNNLPRNKIFSLPREKHQIVVKIISNLKRTV